MPILNDACMQPERIAQAGILPLPVMRPFPIAIALLLPAAIVCAQGAPQTAQSATANYDAALHNYESCNFDDGLQIVKIDSLPPGPQERTIHTMHGTRTIHMLDGRRILFAYGIGGDYFANVKPEVLPEAKWQSSKEDLLDEVQSMVRSDFTTMPNTSLPHTMNGLEVHGMDRTNLKGGTLGFYLIFDNTHHIATSVYLLNQDPLTRHFRTIAQYRALRTHFLESYTACVAQNQSLQTAAKDGQ